MDPTPPGAFITGVTARSIGLCDGRPADIAVGATNLGTVLYTGTSCVCSAGPCSFTNAVSGVVPSYVEDGVNTVSLLNTDPNFVVTGVELVITYQLCVGGAPNGVLEASEECDDNDADDTDGCLSNCRLATCGDGFVRAGVE